MGRILQLAQRLRAEYRTDNPFEICERSGITVIETELPRSINGFYHVREDVGIICINDALEERMKTVVCAHELGHSLLHGCSNTFFMKESTHFVIGRMEREADLFCACLLMPDSEIEEYVRDSLTVERIANLTGLPERIVKLRFGME